MKQSLSSAGKTKHAACIAGIGGFALFHHKALKALEEEGSAQLLATCDPRHQDFSKELSDLQIVDRKVRIFDSFDAMLNSEAAKTSLVTIATPIRWHAPMHAACVERKLACYLEKPPTLDPAELERMIALDATAQFQTNVGFSYLVEPWRHQLKERLLTGEFGRLLSADALGCWQRSSSYFNRSPWAGKLSQNGHLLLDSCFGNAMSHHVHNILFFAGSTGVSSWASIKSVKAELYRANPIESPDTIFTEACTTTGIPLRVAMTHACSSRKITRERLHLEKAIIEITPGSHYEIRHDSGKVEHEAISQPTVTDNIRCYLDYLDGRSARPLTTLADCRPMVAWNALLYVAAGRIHDVPAHHLLPEENKEKGTICWTINGIESVLDQFSSDGTLPSERGITWSTSGGSALLSELSSIDSIVGSMKS